MRLDSRVQFPSGMEDYLESYGWHFSKKMCEYASKRMYRKGVRGNKEYIIPYTKEQVETLLKRFNINIPVTYDAVYIANMCKADFMNSSIADEAHLALYVKDVIGDEDAYEGMVFTRYYADCIGSGTPIDWEDMI